MFVSSLYHHSNKTYFHFTTLHQHHTFCTKLLSNIFFTIISFHYNKSNPTTFDPWMLGFLTKKTVSLYRISLWTFFVFYFCHFFILCYFLFLFFFLCFFCICVYCFEVFILIYMFLLLVLNFKRKFVFFYIFWEVLNINFWYKNDMPTNDISLCSTFNCASIDASNRLVTILEVGEHWLWAG